MYLRCMHILEMGLYQLRWQTYFMQHMLRVDIIMDTDTQKIKLEYIYYQQKMLYITVHWELTE
jgi:hypothetical protein